MNKVYKRINGELVQSCIVEPGVWIRAKAEDNNSIQKLFLQLCPNDMEERNKKVIVLYIDNEKNYMMIDEKYLLTVEIEKENCDGKEQKPIMEFANTILSMLTSEYKEDAGDICNILCTKDEVYAYVADLESEYMSESVLSSLSCANKTYVLFIRYPSTINPDIIKNIRNLLTTQAYTPAIFAAEIDESMIDKIKITALY